MDKQLTTRRKLLSTFLLIGICGVLIIKLLTVSTTENSSSNTVINEQEQKSEQTIETVQNIDSISPVPLDVPLIQQMPELARGCEVTSLAMILQYHGINVNKMELAENIAYEPFRENGLMGNMNKGFVGNMETFQESGLGVYVYPIIELAQQYIEMTRIINITGQSTDELYNAIDAGSPVWVITNSLFSHLPEEQFRTWQTAEGSMQVTYRQHSVVITYYNDEYVYINDPLQSEKNIAINRTNFEEAWIQMGRQAFYISN